LRAAEVEVREACPDPEIQAALLTLPEHFRIAVYYADVEGLSCLQIANKMRTPEGTVASRLHRGRTRLREQLSSCQAALSYLPSRSSGVDVEASLQRSQHQHRPLRTIAASKAY
jgi:RNA polymerase sigma-70 factor, ECF subfamily